jgi:hypothetical protein
VPFPSCRTCLCRSGFAQAGLIRHPESLERTGFRLEFIPMKIGAGMTTFMKTVVYGQTLINLKSYPSVIIFDLKVFLDEEIRYGKFRIF